MAKIRVTLCVEHSHLPHLGTIAKAARKLGMHVEHQLGALGVLTGLVDEDKLHQLRLVKGVLSVERERDVGVPPPGSPVQ